MEACEARMRLHEMRMRSYKRMRDYTEALDMVRADLARWRAFDENENWDADYGGAPGEIITALEMMEEKVLRKMSLELAEMKGYEKEGER